MSVTSQPPSADLGLLGSRSGRDDFVVFPALTVLLLCRTPVAPDMLALPGQVGQTNLPQLGKVLMIVPCHTDRYQHAMPCSTLVVRTWAVPRGRLVVDRSIRRIHVASRPW